MTQPEPPSTPTPGGAPRRRHGLGRGRAARRADRRSRTWGIVAIVATGFMVCAAAAVGAALVLGGGETAASSPVARRSAPTTASTGAAPGPTTSTTAAGPPCRAPLTADAPMRLWIAGDSIAWSVGNGLGKRAAGTGVVAPVYESRVSSGLSTPGFFDWPRRAAEELGRMNPEVVVFVMGTNDWAVPQPAPVDATGQPAWKAVYARQVQTMVDALTSGGRTLYWVGPPVLRDPKQEAGIRAVAEVIEAAVERHPHAVFVDAHDLLDGDDGTYTPLAEIDGKKVQVRTGDGVHLTPDGGDYVGDAVFAALDAQCRLKAQAVAGQRQPLVETRGSTSVPPGATATAPAQPSTPTTATAPPASATSSPTTSTTGAPTSTTPPTNPTTTTLGVTTPTTKG